MVKRNRKGEFHLPELLGSLVVIVVLVFIYLAFISGNKDKITDATDEVSSWLNFANPNCDYDHDGLNNVNDVCPCDDDNDYASHIYYLKSSQCEVKKMESAAYLSYSKQMLAYDSNPVGAVPQKPAELKNEYDNWIYYIDALTSKECASAITTIVKSPDLANSALCAVDKAAYDSASRLKNDNPQISYGYYQLKDFVLPSVSKIFDSIKTLAGGNSPKTSVLLFPEKCAEKILAQNVDLKRATFKCKTSTTQCKTLLKGEKCI